MKVKGSLGGHSHSRASRLASDVWCLLVGTVTVGQADFRSSNLWSLVRHTAGTASCHPGMGIQEREAGRGEVEASLGEVLSRQEQVDD